MSLKIETDSIPSLNGKVAVITGSLPLRKSLEHKLTILTSWLGGASGIGLAAAKILLSKGAEVHILDLEAPLELSQGQENVYYHQCDVIVWGNLRAVFNEIGRIDYAFANAGASEEADYFADTLDHTGELQEPAYHVIDLNFRAVANFVKLAWSSMRRNKVKGSIVITTSATAYAPEQSLPVFSGTKLAASIFGSWIPDSVIWSINN